MSSSIFKKTNNKINFGFFKINDNTKDYPYKILNTLCKESIFLSNYSNNKIQAKKKTYDISNEDEFPFPVSYNLHNTINIGNKKVIEEDYFNHSPLLKKIHKSKGNKKSVNNSSNKNNKLYISNDNSLAPNLFNILSDNILDDKNNDRKSEGKSVRKRNKTDDIYSSPNRYEKASFNTIDSMKKFKIAAKQILNDGSKKNPLYESPIAVRSKRYDIFDNIERYKENEYDDISNELIKNKSKNKKYKKSISLKFRKVNTINISELIKNKISEKISNDELNEYYVPNSNIVKEYAYKEEQNLAYRNYMEDKGKSIDNFNNNLNNILFCLFDGHGGDMVSNFLQLNFASEFKNIINDINKKETIENLFSELDQKFKTMSCYEVGSTACIVYITIENNKKYLYCFNIGDTKCILLQDTGSRKISYDDLATDTIEYKRIINDGGIIINDRVGGKVMVSRAFGDWEQKECGLISVPHINKIEINECCKFVIIATDGVWDVLDELDVYKMSLYTDSSKELCEQIINDSIDKESRDNLSCFVIKLN